MASKSTNSLAKAHIAVLLSGCMWGSLGIFVRVLDNYGYSVCFRHPNRQGVDSLSA